MDNTNSNLDIWEKTMLEERNTIEIMVAGIKSRMEILKNMYNQINMVDTELFTPQRLQNMSNRDIIQLKKTTADIIAMFNVQVENDMNRVKQMIDEFKRKYKVEYDIEGLEDVTPQKKNELLDALKGTKDILGV